MVKMSGAIAEIVVEEYGTAELLRRLSDPYWFQSLSCAIGFDWHSSGTTTVTMGALKEALKRKDLGIAVAGGKGRTSRNAPYEIRLVGKRMDFSEEMIDFLINASRMTAKVDSAAIQDRHQIYQHTIIMDENVNWAVIQQGLWEEKGYARRYHWLGEKVRRFSEESHEGIAGIDIGKALDMTSKDSMDARKTSIDLVNDGVEHIKNEIASISPQRTLFNFDKPVKKVEELTMPKRINWDALRAAYEFQPKNYDELIGVKGMGPATVRALALVSELIYGESPSWRDPVRYSFAVGGKDGVPHPVNKKAMDEATRFMEEALSMAKIGDGERIDALRRLKTLAE
jgi:hypothetical protein